MIINIQASWCMLVELIIIIILFVKKYLKFLYKVLNYNFLFKMNNNNCNNNNGNKNINITPFLLQIDEPGWVWHIRNNLCLVFLARGQTDMEGYVKVQ